ncbi:MAG: DUF4382 domain-containing protein [Acidobacterium ailaaui]|nr:DUF4382 domain-containing protein [Pseudacidobacterium ailaaui]MDI3255309.1 DUF4382 domain-containing protein [Bacillota bacterium]
MLRKSSGKTLLLSVLSVPLALLLVSGCGTAPSGSNSSGGTSSNTAPAFVIGTDAPRAGVTSFSVQVMSINALDAQGNSVSLLSGSPTVDFARYNGLQTLLDMNDVPAGTYNSIVITLGSATIGYLQTQQGAAPTIQTMPAVLTQSTITETLSSPLVVAQTGPVGIRLDFDLYKSIQVDSSGQITGQVTPTFDVKAIGPDDPGAYIDEFDAGVVSVNASGQSFVIQGPHGHQFTVQVNGQTEWDNNESINQLTSNSIVQISGVLDRADSTIDADEVAILSQDGFYASGQITYVQPSSGTASSFDLYVRGLLPASTGLSLGQIAQVNLTGNEKYFIYWMHNPLSQFLFNSGSLLPGQHVSIGGPASGASNPQAVTVKRVVLRHWGYVGTLVPNSVKGNTFQMNVTGFAGLLVPGTVTVYVTDGTHYRGGLNGLNDVSSAATVRVVGLLIRDPFSGNLVLLAHYVDDMD